MLSNEDRKQIEAVITESETGGPAEIVVAVTRASDSYAAWRALGTALLTLSTTLWVHYLYPQVHVEWLWLLEAGLGVVFWMVCGLPWVLRMLAPDHVEQKAVHRHALITFLNAGVAHTARRTGVLILVSELERRVEILADLGIHERVGVSGWQTHVDRIVDSVRQGHAVEGICQSVRAIAAEIHHVLPVVDKNLNELPNRVLDVE